MDKRLIAALSDRVTALENAVLGRPVEHSVDSATDRRLTKASLARRRGNSTRTVDRDVERGLLPPPEIENGRCYWWLSTVQRHERKPSAAPPDARHPRTHASANEATS